MRKRLAVVVVVAGLLAVSAIVFALDRASHVDLTATCHATEAEPSGPIVALIGRDAVPTAFDLVNTGACEFTVPVARLVFVLRGEGKSQSASVTLPNPTTRVSFPIGGNVAVPRVSTALLAGEYQRSVTAWTEDGDSTPLPGFEPVVLADGQDSL